MLSGSETCIPCTPQSVLTILDHEKINVQGKDVVIINHSTIVGKPLAVLLLNRNATVTVCHVFTNDIRQYTTKADILITATGKPRFLTPEHIKLNACVIDVGIVTTKEGVCGDVDFERVKEKAQKITPVPGGVGPVTIACCLQNIVKTYKSCIEAP
jgi:methylenetetrahydrofolate dehydrogenase (NADP+)/methenyltetrahydrofolate cyclohydrolase